MLHRFLVRQDSHLSIRKVTSGNESSDISDQQYASDINEPLGESHRSIAIGGTWDHIHTGHKLLLTMFAFLLDASDSVQDRCLTVGVTGDELLKSKKYRELLQSWDDRQHSVRSFLAAIMDFRPSSGGLINYRETNEPGPNGHAIYMHMQSGLIIRLVEIWDPFGPTITDEAISALVLSAETRSGGRAVNERRKEKNWHLLEIFEVDILNESAEPPSDQHEDSFEAKLSSTKIRETLSRRAKLRSIA